MHTKYCLIDGCDWCNMYDIYLFHMLFTKFLVDPDIGDIESKQVAVNKMFVLSLDFSRKNDQSSRN